MSPEKQRQYSTAPTYPLRIDRDQATTQLKTLGDQPSGAIYVRVFLPKEDPRYGPSTGRKADKLSYASLGGTR